MPIFDFCIRAPHTHRLIGEPSTLLRSYIFTTNLICMLLEVWYSSIINRPVSLARRNILFHWQQKILVLFAKLFIEILRKQPRWYSKAFKQHIMHLPKVVLNLHTNYHDKKVKISNKKMVLSYLHIRTYTYLTKIYLAFLKKVIVDLLHINITLHICTHTKWL